MSNLRPLRKLYTLADMRAVLPALTSLEQEAVLTYYIVHTVTRVRQVLPRADVIYVEGSCPPMRFYGEIPTRPLLIAKVFRGQIFSFYS